MHPRQELIFKDHIKASPSKSNPSAAVEQVNNSSFIRVDDKDCLDSESLPGKQPYLQNIRIMLPIKDKNFTSLEQPDKENRGLIRPGQFITLNS